MMTAYRTQDNQLVIEDLRKENEELKQSIAHMEMARNSRKPAQQRNRLLSGLNCAGTIMINLGRCAVQPEVIGGTIVFIAFFAGSVALAKLIASFI